MPADVFDLLPCEVVSIDALFTLEERLDEQAFAFRELQVLWRDAGVDGKLGPDE